MARSTLAVLVLAITACGGSPVAMTHGGRTRLIDVPPRVRRAPAWESAVHREPPPPGRPFAPSPITPFAEQITDFALAALEGRALPCPVPLRQPLVDAPEVRWSARAWPRPRRLDVLAVALEMELVLKRGEPADDARGVERWGTLRTTVGITRNGVRLVSLRPGAITADPQGGEPPPGLEGLRAMSSQLLSDLRRGDMSSYALTEADRQLLANDSVWIQVHEDGPPLRRAHELSRMLDGLPDTPLAYWLDDIGILARDEEGRLYALTLELDPYRGSFALSTSPLVEVRRLWPE